MNTNTILLIVTIMLSLASTASACSHRPADDGLREPSGVIVLAGDKDRGWLGVGIEEVTRKLVRREELKVHEGVYVTSVRDDSPADHAGIQRGDVIVEYDGRKVYDEDDLLDDVRRTKPGTEVVIVIDRKGERKNVKAIIERYKTPRAYSFHVPSPPRVPGVPRGFMNKRASIYGLTLEELNKQLGEYFGAPNGRGVLVKSVEKESEGEKAGFKAGDVITKVGAETIRDIDDFCDAIEGFKRGEKATVEILRKGATQKFQLTIAEQDDISSRFNFNIAPDDDDIIIDLDADGGRHHFRFDSDHMRREAEKLKRELEHLKDDLNDKAIELRDNIKRTIERVHRYVTV
jgi:membrane-associated protease RseP (regulator of RpoE activity)